jgi:hypothetical protein
MLKTLCLHNVYSKVEEIKVEQDEIIESMPKVFTTFKEWPKKISIPCFNCHRVFKNAPWLMPLYIDRSNNIVKIHGNGCYCSENCVQSDINKLQYNEIINKSNMLLFLCEHIFKKERNYITPAETFTTLKKYGGKKSEKDFELMLIKLRKSDMLIK